METSVPTLRAFVGRSDGSSFLPVVALGVGDADGALDGTETGRLDEDGREVGSIEGSNVVVAGGVEGATERVGPTERGADTVGRDETVGASEGAAVAVGPRDGASDSVTVGSLEGAGLGRFVVFWKGASTGDVVVDFVGDVEGSLVGDFVGVLVGDFVGNSVGDFDGSFVGDFDGFFVGDSEDLLVGELVGFCAGSPVGDVVARTGDLVGNNG